MNTLVMSRFVEHKDEMLYDIRKQKDEEGRPINLNKGC